MEGLKFEYDGTIYNVPCMPKKEWAGELVHRTIPCYGGKACGALSCSRCIYSKDNAEARKAFYYRCFPEEKPVEAEKCCKECANYKPMEELKKCLKLTQEAFNKPDCPEWAQWAAVDSDGKAYWYSKKPEPKGTQWYRCAQNPGKYQQIENSTGKKFDASDWQDSLIERPIKKLPKLTQEVFNRPDCPEWARYAVLDPLGNCYFSFNRPSRGFEVFWKMNGRFSVLAGEQFDASDWENSVIERSYFSSYKILTETNFVALEHNVKELMKQGWIPRGGAVKDDYSYMQTMVKR